jgi:glycosyltransferase involved in cell wall biosynthesis
MPRRSVTVIATVRNEEDSIGLLLESLRTQTRAPDEIIITDAGSSDRTQEIINGYISEGLAAILIVEPRANRARGRNLAIAAARGEVIASIDGGCHAVSGWLAALVAPFEQEEPPDVVCGFYQPDAHSLWEEAVAAATVPTLSEVQPTSFLPSGRSVAFTRAAWEKVGGYPEFIDYAEDTVFGRRLRRARCRFDFAPHAVVLWRMQRMLPAVFRQFSRYARSDGELGHWFGHYLKAFALAGVGLLALLMAALSPRAALCLPPLAALYWWRYAARARRRRAEWPAALLSPVVNLVVDCAHVLGYSVGRLRRRPRAAPLPADRPLSVAQVTYSYRPVVGGADVYASQLADLFAAQGHQQVVYQRRAETDAAGVRFVPNPLHGRGLEFWTHALALLRLWRDLLSHDVVICHYPHYLLAVHLVSLGRRRPLLVGLSHGVFWDDAPRSLRGRLKVALARLAFRRAHLYVANDTHFLRAMGLRIEPGQHMHSQVAPGVWFIPNGVDLARFQFTDPAADLLPLNAILVPRNLYRNRGIHLAIDAFRVFRANHPETTLLIVGEVGQPDYAAELRSQVAEFGLGSSVLFRGPAPHDQLPTVYSAAQLTLIPSLCGEGTSLSALESMACGTATLCTYVAGLRDLPGPHAVPIARNLAEVMEELWPRRRQVGEEQRAAIVDRYSLEAWRASWRRALSSFGAESD